MSDLVTGKNNKNNGNYKLIIDNTKLFVFSLFICLVFCPSCSKTMRQGQSVIAQIISPVPKNMVFISGGTFIMGSPTDEPKRNNEREGPQHQVTISSFYIAKYPVTQSEFQAVNGVNPSHFKGDNLPVENINWYEAIEYCNLLSQKEGLSPAYTIDKSTRDPDNQIADDNNKWLVTWNRNTNGYRLPTEAEWEYACRAGTITPFYTGNNITTDEANYNGYYPYNNNPKGVYREKTTEVGSFASNSWGIYDMHGNVWEWCWDWYGDYSVSVQTDPVGASSGFYRVIRGGSWHDSAEVMRSALRFASTPSFRENSLGFRVVRP